MEEGKTISCVIIEDEEASRLSLINFLQKYCPEVELLGEATNIIEGEKLIHSKKPQLVFLDIEMPFGNAFDLLEQFNPIPFQIIFITAFSHYAIKAINLSACKYLLKPLNINELIAAVNAAKINLQEKTQVKNAQVLLDNLKIQNQQLQKIVLPTMEGFEVIVLKDLVRCQANDNLSDFYLSNGKKATVCNTLKHFEKTLEDFNFVRTHKSHLININYVKSYRKGKTGEILLHNQEIIPLSPTKKDAFIKALNLL